MISFILAGIIAFASIVLWFMILASDPSNTDASAQAAHSVLITGLCIAAIIVASHWLIAWLGW